MCSDKCVNLERNKQSCPCKKVDCKNHGLCCDCVANHAKKDYLPSCLRHFQNNN